MWRSRVNRHAQEVIEKYDSDDVLLPGSLVRSGRLKCVSRTDPDCAMATSRRGFTIAPKSRGIEPLIPVKAEPKPRNNHPV